MMKVEILTLCDAATEHASGKLNILVIDRLDAAAEPITHPQCALAFKLDLSALKRGRQKIRLYSSMQMRFSDALD